MTITPPSSVELEFHDNQLLPMLYGEQNANLKSVSKKLSVEVACRGNLLTITGDASSSVIAEKVFRRLYHQLQHGQEVTAREVDDAIRIIGEESTGADLFPEHDLVIKTWKKNIQPRSLNQRKYIQQLHTHDLVFGMGPAGTGKTYVAAAMGVSLLKQGVVDRLILSRPAVEAGERIGFLPGDLKDKVDPYLRPLYDALYDTMPGEQVEKCIENGDIEIAPLAFMRGRTLSNAYVILDEAQNTTPIQMKMFLTRLGENSRMVVTGDASQVDLPSGMPSGLKDAADRLKGLDRVAIVNLTEKDIVRHGLVTQIVNAYESKESK